jgi:hypothetical protein
MKFQFMRQHDDGHLTAISGGAGYGAYRGFMSVAEAKAAAPDFLATRRGGGKIVLVEILEEVICTATVRYELYGKGIQVQKT